MSVNLLVSTGTMVGRSNGYDYKRAMREISELCGGGFCSGCELMMLTFYYDKLGEVIKCVRDSGARAATIHCEKEVGTMLSDAGVLSGEGKDDEAEKLTARVLELFRLNCFTAGELEIGRMVLHLWGGYSSDKNITYNISMLGGLSEIAREYGVRLLIENVPSNTGDPLSNWRSLLPYLGNGGLIFDTRFGKLHEQSREILTSDVTGLIEHIHVSDYSGGYRNFAALRPILHPGEGVIDFEEIASLLQNLGYSGTMTLESPVMEGAELNIPKIKNTLVYLDGLFNRKYKTTGNRT